jgi:creatinine amidohydrolase
MQWEELTAADFARAVTDTGVCVLAMGVVEKHGEHMPLGTDYLNGHAIACLAARKEPAVVFPPFYFGQIYEARCFPGTLTLRPVLLLDLVLAMFDEIGRNGFGKIVLYNAHGGNTHFVRFLTQCVIWEEKPYAVYLPANLLSPEREKKWRELCETDEHGHACECETSVTMANRPDLVKMDRVPQPAVARRRLSHLPPTLTATKWYSDYPEHYAGDARPASEAKGLALRQIEVDALAEYIAAVKTDTVVPALNREFYERVRNVGRNPH